MDLANFKPSMGTDVVLAVFVRNLADQCQFYSMRGEWLARKSVNVRFSVPRFVQPDMLNDILPYMPTDEVAEDLIDTLQPLNIEAPRDAGLKLLKKMTQFHQSADNIFRSHADRLNRTYEVIAPSKITAGRTSMSLGQIAITVLQKKDKSELTPAMMWAVHRAVMRSQNIMCDLMSARQNVSYEIFPQRNLAEISQVRDWVREYQESITERAVEAVDVQFENTDPLCSENPIVAFVKKARLAVRESRLTRVLSPNGCLGPSSVKVPLDNHHKCPYDVRKLQKFSEHECTIIHYMDAWVTSHYLNPATNLSALGPMILRAVGMYEGFELDESIGFTFLMELGIIAPWENKGVHSLINLRLPGHEQSSETTQLRAAAWKESDLSRNVDSFKLEDSMDGSRKDWTDLPVFCIDSADTLERDDGISVEPVDGTDSEYWIRVHVANPSAFIKPDSATGEYAARLSESVYFPERKYPMLHPWLTAEYLGLADNRPCLTFSARMTTEGDILESQINPGVIRDVHYLTPQSVSEHLGINNMESTESVSLVKVGEEMPAIPKQEAKEAQKPLTPSHVAMLRNLLELGEASRVRRTRNGAPNFYSSARIVNTTPRVYLGMDVPPFQLNDKAITRYEGDPIISIEQTTTGYGLVAKMVSDLMVLAGEVAASWCLKRHIPIPYRGIARNPEPSTSPENFREEVLDPKIEENGHANQWDLVRYMRLVGSKTISATPLEHMALGLPAYCKVTSPLRRHVDMFTHWQIEAALRQEAKTGTSLVGNKDTTYLPFSHATVEAFGETTLQRERKISSAKTGSMKHWITQAMFRAFYFKEAPLPETFEVRMHLTQLRYDSHQKGWLTEWGIGVDVAVCEVTEREGGLKVGDVWEARIANINPYYKAVRMEPIRLLEREQRFR